MINIDSLVAPDVRAYLAALAVLAGAFALALPWALEFTSRPPRPREQPGLDEHDIEAVHDSIVEALAPTLSTRMANAAVGRHQPELDEQEAEHIRRRMCDLS